MRHQKVSHRHNAKLAASAQLASLPTKPVEAHAAAPAAALAAAYADIEQLGYAYGLSRHENAFNLDRKYEAGKPRERAPSLDERTRSLEIFNVHVAVARAEKAERVARARASRTLSTMDTHE
jgi:hypothetical protein